MLPDIESRFAALSPAVNFCSLRVVREVSETLTVRQDIVQPVRRSEDLGAMVTVIDGGGLGYAATADLTDAGLSAALEQAREWAQRTAAASITDYSSIDMPRPQGEYQSVVHQPWSSMSLAEKIARIRAVSSTLNTDDRVTDWSASLWNTESETLYLSNTGARLHQQVQLLVPNIEVVVSEGSDTQTRSFGARGHCRQGGLEILQELGYDTAGPALTQQALELLAAPDCPSESMPVLLAPDQMLLQIHESIGHPLELDRILGDERNYAGTSFVTLDMFGSYQYGSELLNVTYDPTRPEEFASYGWDDDGVVATKEWIIKDGLLERPLGSVVSQTRAGIQGVANSRANGWNRPPIDRMANLNVEPGESTLEEMIAGVERGVYMATNRSWSIDDSRNKFQFGCEWAQLIENGELTTVVKNPNYRGISATFWRSLSKVGNAATVETMGSPYCGKGEPNQAIRVGHASPACLFDNIDVFGGA